MHDRKEDLEILTGVESIEETLDSAMHVWNAFWGPLRSKNVTKETLLNNRDLVFALVEATVPKLISKTISLEESNLALASKLDVEHANTLEALSLLSKQNPSLCVEQESTGSGLPTWKLTIFEGPDNLLEYEITHSEYVKYFAHVKSDNPE